MAWQSVPRANFMFLHAARLQAHYAAQWLARAARGYIAPQPHDFHTNLGWDDQFGGFTTHPLPDGSRLGLRIADLTLAFLDQNPHALPLDGRADAEVKTWLRGHVAARNLVSGKLDDPLPYALPDHALALGGRYSLDELGDAFPPKQEREGVEPGDHALQLDAFDEENRHRRLGSADAVQELILKAQ